MSLQSQWENQTLNAHLADCDAAMEKDAVKTENGCPHCDSGDGELQTDCGDYYVQCEYCQSWTEDYKTIEDAIDAWNDGEIVRAEQ